MNATISGERLSRSPMILTLTPLALSSARSLRMKRLSRPISIATSSGGRLQFSEEKLYMVRNRTSCSIAERTARRTASTPRRWPSNRGSPRACAQRPLPSMMMPTCVGVWSVRGPAGERNRAMLGTSGRLARRLDLHDLLFLGGERGVDLLDGEVGRLLHF